MTNPTRDSAENTVIDNASAADDGDWLGYGVYADALWSRIETALAKDLIKGELGDDPLVIGVFGEWGAGKSHLLKLMHKKAHTELKVQIKSRVSDPGFILTVPVWFQPWKYEHEEHLHVPLVMHIVDALKSALKQDPTVIQALVEAAPKALESIEKTVSVVERGVKVAKAAYPVLQKLLASLSVFGVKVELPEQLEDWLGDDAEGNKTNEAAKKADTATSKQTTDDHIPKYMGDGGYFYRIHELLGAITRPGLYKDRKSLFKHAELTDNTRINFVVFIDDLDRCLPEKAVQVLELIKTVFNVESFAFVLALDDEVIERGIGHRYKEYKLQDKKPEMPITGFEYLEKIVHLPFRLPALTPGQAKEFVRYYENAIEAKDKSLHWFGNAALVEQTPEAAALLKRAKRLQRLDELGQLVKLNPGSTSPSDGGLRRPPLRPNLLPFVIAAFDAYVPRKLIRLVELLHQTSRIAAREVPPRPLGQRHDEGHIDLRLVLFLAMVQLFHPDLFRLFKRRPRCFRELFDAFLPRATSSPTPHMRGLHDGMADIDLWHWATYNVSHAEHKSDRPSSRGQAVEWMAGVADTDRGPAQRIRLPLVEVIVEHRAAQRHVFDALKLVAALVKDGVVFGTDFKIETYFSLLTPTESAPTSVATTDALPTPWAGKRMAAINVQRLYESLLSPNRETQEKLAADNVLKDGEMLRREDVGALLAQLNFWLADKADGLEKQRLLLRGLSYLAPYVAPGEGKQFWDLVKDSVDLTKPTDPKLRALWGDVRSALGCDLRFDTRAPHLLRERFKGHSEQDEPIPGFVRVPAGQFVMGSEADKDNNPRNDQAQIEKDFYIHRTQVTVAQFADFVQDKGYQDTKRWWDKQGMAWRNGGFDSEMKIETFQIHLKRRGVDLRQMPMDWNEQQAFQSRPVTGLTWFESRAYARWLNQQLGLQLAQIAALQNYQVLLPTELQWERAARATSLTARDELIWPWNDSEDDGLQTANIENQVGHPSAVGLYPANPIGLHDMTGNVLEWMDNLYGSTADAFARLRRDHVLVTAEDREKCACPARRGDSWIHPSEDARYSFRYANHPDGWSGLNGFRVVLSLPNFGSPER